MSKIMQSVLSRIRNIKFFKINLRNLIHSKLIINNKNKLKIGLEKYLIKIEMINKIEESLRKRIINLDSIGKKLLSILLNIKKFL